MPRVYLETSFISACVSERGDPASVYRHHTSLDWWGTQRHGYDLFISEEVRHELAHPNYPNRTKALEWIEDIPLVVLNEQVSGLAEILVQHRVMPGPLAGDTVHVAAAIVHRLDYVLSWNVRHLANPNKFEHLQGLCLRFGLVAPVILTPDMLWDAYNEPDEHRH